MHVFYMYIVEYQIEKIKYIKDCCGNQRTLTSQSLRICIITTVRDIRCPW